MSVWAPVTALRCGSRPPTRTSCSPRTHRRSRTGPAAGTERHRPHRRPTAQPRGPAEGSQVIRPCIADRPHLGKCSLVTSPRVDDHLDRKRGDGPPPGGQSCALARYRQPSARSASPRLQPVRSPHRGSSEIVLRGWCRRPALVSGEARRRRPGPCEGSSARSVIPMRSYSHPAA